MPINYTLDRSRSSDRSRECTSLSDIQKSNDNSNFFRAVKNTTDCLIKELKSHQSSAVRLESGAEPYQKRTLSRISGINFYQFSPTCSGSPPTTTLKKAKVSLVTQASSAQVTEPVQQQEERPETAPAQKKNKSSRSWQGIKDVFSFLFQSFFPRTKIKNNNVTAIRQNEIAEGKTVSKKTLEELSNKIDELVEEYGSDGLFRKSGDYLHLNKLTQQVNSGEKIDIDKINNRDTAIGFFKKIMESVTPLKYEEVQTILSNNKITHKEIGEEISKIITSKYPEEFLMILKKLGKFFEKASNNENSQFNVTSFTTSIPNLIKCESENLNLFAKQSKERPKMIEKILHKDTLEAIFTNITITSL